MATKTYYGYKKRGDKIHVYEADMRMRPDLFRPVNPPKEQMPTVGMRGRVSPQQERPQVAATQVIRPKSPPPQKLPPPPTMIGEEPERESASISAIEWGSKLNSRNVQILADANVHTLQDARELGEVGLMAITGIGPAIARTLLEAGEPTDQE